VERGRKAGCNKTATESTSSGIITEQETKENYYDRPWHKNRVSKDPIWKQAGSPGSLEDKRFWCQEV